MFKYPQRVIIENVSIQFNAIYFKDSLCHSNQASKVKTKDNITEHKRK